MRPPKGVISIVMKTQRVSEEYHRLPCTWGLTVDYIYTMDAEMPPGSKAQILFPHVHQSLRYNRRLRRFGEDYRTNLLSR